MTEKLTKMKDLHTILTLCLCLSTANASAAVRYVTFKTSEQASLQYSRVGVIFSSNFNKTKVFLDDICG